MTPIIRNLYAIAAFMLIISAISAIGYSTPTVPLQSPNCCAFETNTCGSSSTWSWSASLPSPVISPISGNFEWTSVNGALWQSDVLSSVYAGNTLFTFQYNVQSTNDKLNISFKEYRSGIVQPVGVVGYTAQTWQTFTTSCASCCGTGSVCDGLFQITSNIMDGNEVAIDNFGQDNECYRTYPCCLFDDVSLCSFTSQPEYGYQWQYSGTTYPYIPVISPGSDFAYFEVLTNTIPYVMEVGLRSEIITINSNTVFRGNILSNNPNNATTNNLLYVNFVNSATGFSTPLAAGIETTYSTWQIQLFSCTYGDCCHGALSCIGYIDFVAIVQPYGSELIFAVDAFEVEGSCGTFPGANNSAGIKFQQ